MSFSNYAALRLEIANVLQRADLVTQIPSMIAMAESQMNQRLDMRAQDTSTTLSTSANVEFVSSPTDLIDIRDISITDSAPYTSLNYITPQVLRDNYGDGATGKPQRFTIVGSSIYLHPKPDGVYTLSCIYKQRITALSDTNTTNYVLTTYPDVYLYGALANSAPYIRDDRIPQWKSFFNDSIEGINKNDWYSGDVMVVRSDVKIY